MSKTLPIAVQVYSVREEAERDFAGTMKKLGEDYMEKVRKRSVTA